jgi:hypothetical protein
MKDGHWGDCERLCRRGFDNFASPLIDNISLTLLQLKLQRLCVTIFFIGI